MAALLILNPEWIELALFIDAVGLEVFIMLLEVQILAIVGALFKTRIKPILQSLKQRCPNICMPNLMKNLRNDPGFLLLAVPRPAAFMHLLVLSAAAPMILNLEIT
ncbi:MAG: hypothetical protein MI756_19765 [Chromatiales bacterium]|nr:hypothetical protein [Chromatiales bacterium]